MEAKQSPLKAHKGGRTETILIRCTQDEKAALVAACKVRKEKGFARCSQADVLFDGLGTTNLGKVLYEYRQELCVMQSIAQQNVKKGAKTPDDKLIARGQLDAIGGMINRLDTILSSYNK